MSAKVGRLSRSMPCEGLRPTAAHDQRPQCVIVTSRVLRNSVASDIKTVHTNTVLMRVGGPHVTPSAQTPQSSLRSAACWPRTPLASRRLPHARGTACTCRAPSIVAFSESSNRHRLPSRDSTSDRERFSPRDAVAGPTRPTDMRRRRGP